MRRTITLLCLLACAAGRAPAPEPDGLWQGPVHGAVPAHITGGAVIHTSALAAMLAHGGAVLIDVSAAPRRPPMLAPGAVWLPLPHRDIPGSVWLPDVGRGRITPELDAFYRRRLAVLTGDDKTRRIVVYCHPECWMSWNAARRAILLGYRHVYWDPDGIEGWRAGGYPTQTAVPSAP